MEKEQLNSDFTLISLRGNRDLWQDFMYKIKKNKNKFKSSGRGLTTK